MAKRVAVFGAFLLLLATISPAQAQEIVAQEIVVASEIDPYLQDYIDQVETKRIPFIVDLEGKNWFEQNTSAKLKQVGNFSIWGVNPGRINAELAVEQLDDNSIFINNRYAIPKVPLSDVDESFVEANPVEIAGADVLHDDGYKGAGKSVAILDTGIQADHEYFEDDAGNSRIVAQACFVQSTDESEWAKCKEDGDADPDTDFSENAADISHMSTYYQEHMDHGTHVAGLAAGRENLNAPGGIAPEADIVAVRVFGSQGADDFDILSALAWVADNAATYNIAAVNLSLGSGLYSPGVCYSDLDIYLDYYYRIFFQYLIDSGVAPLVATGNDGSQNRIGSPACVEPAIAIGSSNAYDTDLSSYESISYYTNISTQLELLAPGNNVMSSLPGNTYGLLSGTSMASPVAAGVFTLLQSISEKPVDDWLTILKDTGTPLDGDYLDNIPRINADWAACSFLDCLVPPTNIDFTTSLVEDSAISWDASPYGTSALNFDIAYGSTSFSVESTISSADLVVSDFTEVVKIRSRNGAEVSDWAEVQPFHPSTLTTFKLKTNAASQIIDVQLAGDYCTSDESPYVAYKYESPTSNLRKIWIDGLNGITSYSETQYIPQNGESLNNDNKTKQILITDPVSVIDALTKAYVVSAPKIGTSYSLSSLYAEIDGAEYSPSAPSGLIATGGPNRAVLNWNDDTSSNWKVLVDGEVVDEVDSSSAVVSLTPGDHEVSVCAIKVSGADTYTSIKTTASVTALPGQYQEIQDVVAPALNVGGKSKLIVGNATSGLNLVFTSQTLNICQVNSLTGTVTPIATGNCLIQISQLGNGTYAAAEVIELNFYIGGQLPGKVRNLKATLSLGKVKVSWKAPKNAGASEVTGYKVKWRVKLPSKKFTSWKTVDLSISKKTFTTKKFAIGAKVEISLYAKSAGGLGLISKTSKTVQ